MRKYRFRVLELPLPLPLLCSRQKSLISNWIAAVKNGGSKAVFVLAAIKMTGWVARWW